MNKIFSFLVLMVFLTTPLESVEISSNFSIVKLVSVALILFTIMTGKNIFAIRDPLFIILLIYTLLTIISFLWSIDQVVTFQKSMITMLPNFIITLIIFHAINEREDIDRMFLAYVTGCVIISAVSFYAYSTGYNMDVEDEGRVTAFNQDQNELSFLLSFGIIAIVYLLKYSSLVRITKYVLLVVGCLLAFVILTTGSRMGLLLLILIASVLVFMNIKNASLVLIIPLIIALSILFYKFLPVTTAERLLQVQDQIENKDLTGRVSIWKIGLMAFENKNAYVFGTGYSTFKTLMASKTGWDPAAHNTYLSTLIELGAAGLAILLSFLIYLIYRVWYLIRNCSLFFILLILPMLATMFVLATGNRRWLFLIAVIIIKLWQFAKEEVEVNEAL
jgi:O-antigen ligase